MDEAQTKKELRPVKEPVTTKNHYLRNADTRAEARFGKIFKRVRSLSCARPRLRFFTSVFCHCGSNRRGGGAEARAWEDESTCGCTPSNICFLCSFVTLVWPREVRRSNCKQFMPRSPRRAPELHGHAGAHARFLNNHPATSL
jgi:hypothetical protein